MKAVLDIPKEFEEHFYEDKFKDSLLRLKADTNYGLEHESTISGNYEIELLDMLVEAFKEAEVIHSTCILEGKPIYNDVLEKQGKWIPVPQTDITKDWKCSNCQGLVTLAHYSKKCYYDYCPTCGADMEGE